MSSLILASESPFRKALLEKLGFEFTTAKPQIDERSLEDQFGGPINEVAQHLAVAKAKAVFKNNPDSVVIGSDQVLIFDNKTFPKPNSLDEAADRLIAMQGQTHELHTGLCVMKKDQVFQTTTVARMKMHSLTESEIRNYVDMDQPLGCAGGYKIELRGPLLFEKIETSDYDSIIGLPTLSLVSILRDWGISRL